MSADGWDLRGTLTGRPSGRGASAGNHRVQKAASVFLGVPLWLLLLPFTLPPPASARPVVPSLTAVPATATPTATPARTTGPSERARGSSVILLTVDGGINPATLDYIRDGLALVHRKDAQALVVQLDTPGGLLSSAQDIVQEFLGASVPVVVYVAPSGGGAISAGVFVTLAAHVAAMAPGTNIGAAHPVGGRGEDIGGDMREKVENAAASLVRTIADKRGRNAEWAEKAVRQSVSITAHEAVEQNVVDLVAENVRELLAKIDGRRVVLADRAVVLATAGSEIEPHGMTWRQRLIDVLANPQIAYLLMMAGLLGLYVEFTHPGVFFPGVAGALCLLLGMAALQVLPINYAGLALIVLGISLMISELFVPSFGVLGLGGVIAFVIGSLLLFDTPDMTLRVDRGLVYGTALAFGGFTLFAIVMVARAQRRPVRTGSEGMLGAVGEVRDVEEGHVRVLVRGEYWNAEAGEPLARGDQVEVTGVSGLRLTVRRKPPRPG